MKKKLLTFALIAPLALTACGSGTWTDEEKLEAWHKQQCKDFSELDANTQARITSLRLVNDNSLDMSERAEVMDVINRLESSSTVGDVVDPDGDLNCKGWLWEDHADDDVPEDFTQEVAAQNGVY